MTTRQPPRLALFFLARAAADREPLAGDILEEFDRGRSRAWLWRQVLSAAAMQLFRPRAPLVLGLDDARRDYVAPGRRSARRSPVNLSGTGTRQVGGLGLLVLILLTAKVVPELWWLVLGAAAAGTALGGAMVLIRRHRLDSGPEPRTRILL